MKALDGTVLLDDDTGTVLMVRRVTGRVVRRVTGRVVRRVPFCQTIMCLTGGFPEVRRLFHLSESAGHVRM